MAKPSSKYDVKGQVNLNTAALPVMKNSAGTWKTLYPEANLPFDNTILYTKPAVKNMVNMTVPFIGTSDPRYSISEPIGSLYNRTGVNVKIYKHIQNAFPTLPTALGYTLGLNTGRASNNGFYFWGKDETKDGTLSTNYDTAIIRDWKYNEIIIRPRIYGYATETIEKVENNEEFNATPIEIQLDELIERPEDYYVSDIRYMSALVWDSATNDWISLAEGFNVFAVYDNNYITGMESTVNQQVSHFLMTKGFNDSSPTKWNASTTSSTYREVIGNLINNTAPRQLSTTYVYGMGYPDTDFELEPNIDIISTRVSSAPILSTTSTVRTGSVHTYGVLYDNIQSRCWYREEVTYDSLNSQNYFSKLSYSFFYLLKGTFVSQIIASFGLYSAPFSGFNPNVDNDQSKPKLTPTTLGLGRKLWLGEMNSKGFTSGNWIPMEDLETYKGYNIDGDSANVDFDPDDGGGGDGPDKLADQFLNPYSLQERFLHRYVLNAQEMNDLAQALESPSLAEINAIQYVVDLSIIPDDIADNSLNTSRVSVIKFGTHEVELPASIVNYSNSIIYLDSVFVGEKYGNFLDYEPYTKLKLYIPFCGTVNLPTDKVMGKYLDVYYTFDYLNGNCIGCVYVGNSLVTTVSGNFYCTVPLSQDVSTQKNEAMVMSAFSTFGQLAATVGIGTATKNPLLLAGGVESSIASLGQTYLDIKQKSDVEMIGGSGNLTMFNMPMECCLYYERPSVDIPDNFGDINGYACNKGGKLSDFHGFTACSDFHLDKIVCTKTEKEMIEDLLKKGVILD